MERVMSELAGYFCQITHLEVHLVLYGRNAEIFYKLPDNITIHIPGTPFNNRLRTVYSIGRLIYLRRRIRRIQPDAVLSFGEYWNSFVLLALRGLPYPVYISDRCSPEMKFSFSHSFLRKVLYPRAAGIIAQTEMARRVLLSGIRQRNIAVIGNPIKNMAAGRYSANREKQVLMVGRLIRTKHQDKLIEMFAKVNLPDWKLIIVGYDHLKQVHLERLKRLAEKLEVEQRVVFLGKQKDMDKIYSQSSVFAFTSSSEGFPNVIGEAMSAGLPVIAFDCIAGPSDLITDNTNGILIPLFNYDLFQEKLKVLMENPDLREQFGSKAREKIRDYSRDRIGEQYYQFMFNVP